MIDPFKWTLSRELARIAEAELGPVAFDVLRRHAHGDSIEDIARSYGYSKRHTKSIVHMAKQTIRDVARRVA
jgi:hypothetical protein